MSATERPTHYWNDPDGDGHNCAMCSSDSIWKCDRAAHPEGTLADDNVAFRLGFVTEDEWRSVHDHDEPQYTTGCPACERHQTFVRLVSSADSNERVTGGGVSGE